MYSSLPYAILWMLPYVLWGAIILALILLPWIIAVRRMPYDSLSQNDILCLCLCSPFFLFIPWIIALFLSLFLGSLLEKKINELVRKFLPRKKTEDLQDTLEKSNNLKKE